MKEFTIGKNEAGQRFDKYLGKLLPSASMSFIYKMIRKKNFLLNKKKATGNELLKQGDQVRLFLSPETFEKFSSGKAEQAASAEACLYSQKELKRLHLDIVYEDEHILIFNKPVGMLSQKAVKEDVSVNEYLQGYLLYGQELTKEDMDTFRPAVANRLDRNTSGLILCGKTLPGLQYLSGIIKNRSLEKYYCCLVEGIVEKPFLIEGYLSKDKKKNVVTVCSKQGEKGDSVYIKTGVEPIKTYKWGKGNYTELSIRLITGKSHQIRAHLASIGHPLAGDFKYGNGNKCELAGSCHLKSQLLHAYKVVFPETEGAFAYLSGKTVTAQPPGHYRNVLKELQYGNLE